MNVDSTVDYLYVANVGYLFFNRKFMALHFSENTITTFVLSIKANPIGLTL